MKLPRLLALTAASLLASVPAFAGLIGATVTGTLIFENGFLNRFDPGNGNVPAGYLNSSPGTNTVVISGAATEFGYQGGSLITANFSETQLFITTDYSQPSTYSPWTMTFSSSAFGGQALNLVSESYAPGLTASLSGDLITINWAGAVVFPGGMRATYNLGSAGVPDGGATAALLAVTLLALAASQRWLKLAR
ncbi:MAG: hypothetical protein JNL39_00355 [Opitutaceae bacterium]|nr:hypothetical protein [Opitutaceae bacterium]